MEQRKLKDNIEQRILGTFKTRNNKMKLIADKYWNDKKQDNLIPV